jgi:hypothetical protein
MASYKNSKEAWRTWYKHAEFQTLLQTETLTPGSNTRDITVQGQGIYTAAIVLEFSEVVTGTGVYTTGEDIANEFLNNMRIKSAGKLTEQLFTSGAVLAHCHHAFLDQLVQIEYTPAAAGVGTLAMRIIIPTTMQSPFNITMNANLGLAPTWTFAPGALTLVSAQVKISVVSSDVAPPLVMAFASQTLNLPTTGSYNATTLTQGFLRESISLLNYTPGQITNLQYILDDGRNIIYADAQDTAAVCYEKYQTPFQFGYYDALQNWYDDTTTYQSDALLGEQIIETAYLSGGQPMPWKGAGRFVINTNGLTPATCDVVEVLIAQPVGQQLAATDKNQPTSQRPRTDLAAGGQTSTGAKPRVKY